MKKIILTQKQKKQFDDNGFVLIRDVIDKHILEKVKDRIDGMLEGRYPSEGYKCGSASQEAENDPGESIKQVMNIWGWKKGKQWGPDPVLLEMGRHPAITSIAAQLLRIKEAWIFQQQAFLKEAGLVNATPWHQDDFYWRSNKTALTAFIPLEKLDKHNGTLYFFPKSHKWGVLDHKPAGGVSLFQTVAQKLDESKCVPVELEPGDVSFHHSVMIHGAPPNKGKIRRISISQHYSIPGSWWLWSGNNDVLMPKKSFTQGIGVSESSVNRWMREEKLKYIKKDNGRVFIKKREFAQFIKTHLT